MMNGKRERRHRPERPGLQHRDDHSGKDEAGIRENKKKKKGPLKFAYWEE